MNPALLMNNSVIVQGISGTHGAFHAKQMIDSGTNIVAGTSPTKAGQTICGVPVYSSIREILNQHTVTASVIFVPAAHAKGAIFEAIDAEIPLIVCITEHIPVHDMIAVREKLTTSKSVLIGPNCPGLLMPDHLKLGIIPAALGLKGSVGIVSRSGTLTYEVAAGLTARGIGQKYIIGIGGDPIHGASFINCLQLFESDSEVDTILLIGEIGGQDEIFAADYIKNHVSKPVFGYIAGHAAPVGVQLGHAGAILSNNNESAAAKTEALCHSGVHMSKSILELIEVVK